MTFYYSFSHTHAIYGVNFPSLLPPDGGAGGQPLPRPNFKIQPIDVRIQSAFSTRIKRRYGFRS